MLNGLMIIAKRMLVDLMTNVRRLLVVLMVLANIVYLPAANKLEGFVLI